MEVSYLGHASFFLKGKSVSLITDPFDPAKVGLPIRKARTDVVTVSHDHFDHNFLGNIEGQPYVVRGPGEYEVKGAKITGIASFHDETGGAQRGRNTIYLIIVDGVYFCHLGDLGHVLEEKQLKLLERVDVLFLPVGGFYTIDAKTAVKVVSQVEPKVVVPMHFQAGGMGRDFDRLASLDDFLREIGEPARTERTFKINAGDFSEEGISLVVLENSLL